MFFITSHLQHKLEVSVQMGFWTKKKSNLLKKKRQIKVTDCQKSVKTETFTLTKDEEIKKCYKLKRQTFNV